MTVNGGVLNVNTSTHLTIATGATTLTLNGGTLRTNHDRATGISNATHQITLGASGGTLEQTGATTFTQAGAVGGAGALTKTGTGTLLLSNVANAYGGITTVSNGTLRVDGLVPGTLTVASIATLQGIGTINGATTVNGTLAPGNGIGTLNFVSSLGLAGTTSIQIDKTPSLVSDLVNGTTIALGGTLTVVDFDADIASYADGDSWNLFDGTLTGAFSSFSLPDVSSLGLSWDTSELAAGGDGTLSLVPEPAALGLLAIGGLVLGRRRR